MELRQLEYFRVIAETESIHEAARRLNMSQPPLSYQLKQLEAELNVTLFERTRQGVRLTEAGKLLYDRSANLLEYVKSTELEVAKVGKKRVLRLGITPTTVATIMPCVSLFSRRNPDVNFEVHDGITYTLYRYLMDGIIDISIARTPLRLDDVDYKILSSEPMIAVSSKDMLPEKNGSLKLSDLLNIPLIIYRRYEALIMDAFHSRGMEPDLFCVCDDPRGAMLWAKEGLATAIFPQSMSSLPGTPHPAARRKRPGNADRRDLEKGAETLSASAGLCRCLHGEHIIIEEVRCASLFFRDQRSGLPFFISHSFYCTNSSAIFSSVTITAIANRAIFSRRLFAYFPMTFFEDVR